MATRTTIFATNDVLDADDLNSLAGAWNSYTPTLTGFTPGNGVATGSYIQFGKLVMFRARFTFGTTSAAVTAAPALTLPVTAVGTYLKVAAHFVDVSGSIYEACASILSTTTVSMYIPGTNGVFTTPTTTTPFTWTTGDLIDVSGIYEAA